MILFMQGFYAAQIHAIMYLFMTVQDHFITEEMLEEDWKAVGRTGACVLGMPSKDTVKLADENAFVKSLQREIMSGIFRLLRFSHIHLIKTAHDKIRRKDMSNITDDAMVVEQERRNQNPSLARILSEY